MRNAKKTRRADCRSTIEFLESRQLLSTSLPDGFVEVGTITVSATSNSYQNFSTRSGANYFLVASGTAKIGNRTDGGGNRNTDATKFDDFTETDVFSRTTSGSAGRFEFSGASDADGGGFSWGAYQSDHIYGQMVTATGSTFGVQFKDVGYGDNGGSMTITMYAGLQSDLEIYKPGVIDTAQGMIADADEATVGSATFVNLDNDDNDAKFDNTDDVVTGGDDELAKLTLKVKNPFNGSQIKLSATSGGGDVKLWKQQDKAAASAYTLGNAIPLTDFVKVGDWFTKDLWVEGITAQNAARGTVLKLEQTFGANTASDEAALTVIGVDKVEWVGYDNAFDDSNTLDADPNWPAGLTPSAKRVFPDMRVFASGGGYVQDPQPRSIMRVKTTLSVAPPFAVKVYLRAFDMDDPSADSDAVDNEAGATDNRGAAGTFGWQASGVTPNADVTKELSFAASETENQSDYIVSMQPGDNYRLVANADNDFLLRLNNNDNELNVGGAAANANKQRIVNQDIPVATNPVDREVRQADKYTSDVLTVWRFLHVERDSMAALPAGSNEISGTVSDIVGTGAALTEVKTATNLADGSNDLDTAAPNTANGRFENGTLTVGTGATAVTITPITGNGTTGGTSRLVFPAASLAGLSFDAADTDPVFTDHNTGTITDVTKSGTTFVWTLNTTSEGEADWSEFVGGTLTVGGVGTMSITAVNKAAGTMTTSSLNIPFTVKDDDTATLPSLPDTGLMVTKYQPAYILPVFDGGGNPAYDKSNIAPSINVDTTSHAALDVQYNKAGAFESEGWRKPEYWVAYVLQGYQGVVTADYDPDGGAEWGPHGINGGGTSFRRGSMVFAESLADYVRQLGLTAANATELARRHVVHEIGYQFGLADNTGGIYSYPDIYNLTIDPVFLPVHLDIIRSTTSPGL